MRCKISRDTFILCYQTRTSISSTSMIIWSPPSSEHCKMQISPTAGETTYPSIKYFRFPLDDRPFTLMRNHKSLTFGSQQNPDKVSLRQTWYLTFISQFISVIRYVPDRDNSVADALFWISKINTPVLCQ